MKSLRIDVVKDPSDFPYYRVSLVHTKLNFAKIDDVLEFVKRHMTVDTDVPMVEGAKKEKQPTTTGVTKTKWVPTTEREKKLLEEILIYADTHEGVTNAQLSTDTGTHYSDVSKACAYLERLGKLCVAEGSRRPKRWQAV